MSGFCYNCGTKLNDRSAFCPNCGKPCGAELQAQQTVQRFTRPLFCAGCGAALNETEAFCGKCGAPVKNLRSEPAQSAQGSANLASAAKSVAASLERTVFSAPNAAGEFPLGSLTSFPSAANVISGGFKNLISSVKTFFKSPKALIPTLAISAVWLILGILKASGVDNTVTKILSTLSFSNAGMRGGALSAIGGIFGKGVFAGALVSLVHTFSRIGKGKGRGFAETLKGSFGFDKNTVWSYTLGAGLALMLFVFMSGGVDYSSALGGAAAAFLSAKSALNGGFLSRLLRSFEAKSKVKILDGIPRGMAAGFSLGAMLGFIPNCSVWLIVAGAVIAVFGAVMMILQKVGALSPEGKEVGAA